MGKKLCHKKHQKSADKRPSDTSMAESTCHPTGEQRLRSRAHKDRREIDAYSDHSIASANTSQYGSIKRSSNDSNEVREKLDSPSSAANERHSLQDNSDGSTPSYNHVDFQVMETVRRKQISDRIGHIPSHMNKTEDLFPKILKSEKRKCYGWWFLCLVVLGLSCGTRLYKIEWPTHVCWDETHFGKMGSWYINRTFFFDVHPPLGKMLIGLAGSLSGYNGNFSFSKPGNKYEDVPYLGMRVFCASLGAAIAPLCYCSTWELTGSLSASLIVGCLVIFDTGLLALCQYILLDPLLLFFIMAANYCLLKFLNQFERSFSFVWWFWLFLTGVFLATAVGVKFVGLFVVALAGVSTVQDLWKILGDLSISMGRVAMHFFARAVCLIVIPVLLYMGFFAVHFCRLSKSGSGDGFFSSAFQSQLEGNALFNANMPAEVAYGSVVTIKNYRTGGGYLHSHLHLYPEGYGARQQQVTTYGHKDDNNRWTIKKVDTPANPREEPELVMNGDLVRLEHISTKRNLHSHRIPAPLTPKHLQVTCYGNEGEGDVNDVFKLEMPAVRGLAPLLTVRTTFKLTHANTGCVLQSHNKQLPKWGWEQMEVTCNPNTRDKNALWNIEEVIDDRLPNRSFSVYAPSFLGKFLESHAVMAQGNSGLKPKEGEITSRPWQWPLNYKGQPFSGGEERVYLLGNPVLWCANVVSMAMYLILCGYHSLRRKRGFQAAPETVEYEVRMFGACGWLFTGWTIHYLPFWFMGRVLYFHHYFPSLLYNFMLTGVILDYIITSLSRSYGRHLESPIFYVLLGALLSGIIYSFYLFHPLAYGMSGKLADEKDSQMYGLKWLDSWDI